jgi:hypothetical protein
MKTLSLRNVLFASALVLAAVTIVNAETVYKSTDKNGNTTYSSKPPATSAEKAKTVEMTIDPNQNVLPVTPVPALPSSTSNQNQSSDDTAPRGSVAEAEAALKATEQALADGQQTQPGDFAGKKGGGVGPSAQRVERINELQAAVDQARAALERARSGAN